MSDLEWKEPTIEELAEWDWRVRCRHGDPMPADFVEWWGAALYGVEWRTKPEEGKSVVPSRDRMWRMGRDLYTLARAVEFERRVEEAYSEADNEVLAFGFEPPSSRARKVVERRDALQSTLIEARQRVDTLTAKVLGRQP